LTLLTGGVIPSGAVLQAQRQPALSAVEGDLPWNSAAGDPSRGWTTPRFGMMQTKDSNCATTALPSSTARGDRKR